MPFLGCVYALFIPTGAGSERSWKKWTTNAQRLGLDFQRAVSMKAGARSRGEAMLDLFCVGITIIFFVLLWGFTKASERM